MMRSLSRKIREKLRSFVHRATNPPPFGLKKLGIKSLIYRPYLITGRRFIEIGDRTEILKSSSIVAVDYYAGEEYQPEMRIGNDVYIGPNVWITCMSKVIIEDGYVFSQHVYISDASHGLDPNGGPIMNQKMVHKGGVHIKENTFVGYRACIMPGVTLGKHCVVGTNSVVTRSFPDYSMVAGSPARLIKVYSHEKNDWVSPPKISDSSEHNV